MKIIVDADACPVIRIVEQTAKQFELPVYLVCDHNHNLNSDYSKIEMIDTGRDAVDFRIVQICEAGDIIVTQDYGVAAMILGKGAYGIHQNGKWYDKENIDMLLMERHLSGKARRSGKSHMGKGQKKRTNKDNLAFQESFVQLVNKIIQQYD